MSTCPPPRDHNTEKVWCFQCGKEYFPEVVECIECGVSTTSQKPPDVAVLGSEGHENLAYDFHEWTGQSRSLLESLLNGARITHVWQGATLLARVEDEVQLDSLIAEVDDALRPSIDPTQPITEYSMQEFTDSQASLITQALENSELPYLISEAGDLIVYQIDEVEVEAIFDTLTTPDPATFGPGVEGADIPYILSELSRLCDKLEMATQPTTTDLTEGKRVLEIIPQLDLPFGFSTQDWEAIRDRSLELAAIFLYIDVKDVITPELQTAATQLKQALPVLL